MFKKACSLSIFQAEMLFAIWHLRKIPRDYGNYHKCKAGKEFIENIKKLLKY